MMLPSFAAASTTLRRRGSGCYRPNSVRIPSEDESDADREAGEANRDVGWHGGDVSGTPYHSPILSSIRWLLHKLAIACFSRALVECGLLRERRQQRLTRIVA